MNYSWIREVEDQANKLLDCIRNVYAEADPPDIQNGATIYGGTKATGALRRASMDLTRALAQMRKP
jgi:hypothetical protein